MPECPTCRTALADGLPVCPHDGTPLRPAGTLTGQVLGERYRVIGSLGEGGMGNVYLTEHVVLGKRFAVKVLRPELSARPDLVTRFQQEAISASRIGQENIVDVVDFGRTPDGRLYYAMEALDGTCLTDLLVAHHRLPVARALPLLAQIARALGAAHAAGIVHRDVKPDNVIVLARESGELAKVLDFGIACVSAEHTGGQRLTREGTIIGTPEYMSPEQAEGDAVDHRADIYAWGVLAYELLTGSLPFWGRTALEVMLAHKTKPPQPPSERCPEARIPPAVEEIVLSALAKSPADRPPSMTEVARELTRLSGELAMTATPVPAAVPPLQLKTPTPARRADGSDVDTLPGDGPASGRRRLGLFAGLGAVLLLAGAGFLLWPRPGATAIPAPEPEPVELAALPPEPAPKPIEIPEELTEDLAVAPLAPLRQVAVNSVPAGAVVLRGRERLGVTPLEVQVPDGAAFVLRFELEGYQPAKRKVRSQAGKVEVRLKPAGEAQPEDEGYGKVEDLKDDPYR